MSSILPAPIPGVDEVPVTSSGVKSMALNDLNEALKMMPVSNGYDEGGS
ncbi:hypothetical protein [Paenibacillus sp. UASWS1643]|nr:hypothetical protein [Paenibacillus sp. UASWS1643]